MYFSRFIDRALRVWAEEEPRKPLVLRGARQTGKSSSVREFGKRFELFIELNLERYSDLSLVRACTSPGELLLALAARDNIRDFPPRTLLFLDEIQESPEAIRWLRFFHEDHPELYVIAAGSLMEVRLEERGFSFPVGRVTFRTLRPFSFIEYLGAAGRDVLAAELESRWDEEGAWPAALHQQAMVQLRDYLVVGGMPEAVAAWARTGNPAAVGAVHDDLIRSMSEDIQKYRGVHDASSIESAYMDLARRYGKRFKYENLVPGFRSAVMRRAIDKLEGALLVTRAWPVSGCEYPLRIRPRSAPKLLPLDMGLALHQLRLGLDTLVRSSINDLRDGAIAEAMAGVQFLADRDCRGKRLHFWVREGGSGTAELDYLLDHGPAPLPVEVKAGASGSLKSLHQYLWRSGARTGVRLHAQPPSRERLTVRMADGDMQYELRSYPLYMAELLLTLDAR